MGIREILEQQTSNPSAQALSLPHTAVWRAIPTAEAFQGLPHLPGLVTPCGKEDSSPT